MVNRKIRSRMRLKTTATGILPYFVLVNAPPGTQIKKAAFSAGLIAELALVEGSSLNTEYKWFQAAVRSAG
jgi:hypothetical protein